MRKKFILTAVFVIAMVAAVLGFGGCTSGDEPSCQHDYDYTVTTQATCTENGSRNGVCKKCGDSVTDVIYALGHTSQQVCEAVEATCEHVGSTEGTICGRCGCVLFAATEIPIREHSYGEDMRCKWCGIVKTYQVTFETDNGSGNIVQTYEHGKEVVFPDAPQKADHVFCGWYVDEEEYIEGSAVTADITICAKWTTRIQIRDIAGLKAIAQHPDYGYVLENDINLRGEELSVIEEFTGILDGQGHTVRDFIIDASVSGGDFGVIKVNKGTVKNIVFREVGFSVRSVSEAETNVGAVVGANYGTVEDISVSDGNFTLNAELRRNSVNLSFGFIVGKNDGNVINCNSNANATLALRGTSKHNNNRKTHNFDVGGIVGVNGGVLNACYYGGTINVQSKAEKDENMAWVINYYNVGGLTGRNAGASALVSDSYCNAHITHKTLLVDGGEEYAQIGGAAGINAQGALIKGSYADGEILSEAENGNLTGGFVGTNESNAVIRGCYSNTEGKVNGAQKKTTRMGGFAGRNDATIQKSYSTGNIVANNILGIGGFVGENLSNGTVRYSYCTGTVEAEGAGNVGYFYGSSAGSIYKCYFLSSTVVIADGKFVAPEQTSGNNAPAAKYASELWNERFLSEELNWDTGDGWLVFADDNPLLSWELGRGHDFKSKVIEPTHEYGGYTAYFCGDCGRVIIKDYLDPSGHTYEKIETVAPTCTGQGYDIVRCTKIGCDFADEVHINFTEATGHRKGSLISAETAATCAETGAGTYICGNCGESFTAEIAATGNHVWIEKEAFAVAECSVGNSGTEGYSAHRLCSVCGVTDGKTVISPHRDANRDNICDRCKEFTFTTVSKADFTEISDEAGLASIKNGLGGYYILVKDIYLSAETWNSIGTKAAPFTGILYGNGHIISGLTVEAKGGDNELVAGLFGYNRGTVIGVTIQYLYLNVTNTNTVFGGIAAYNSGKIIDCKLMGDNVLQYNTDKTFVNERGGKESYVYTLTAGGFAGVNNAGGVISGCAVGGRFISRNAVYGKIKANVGSTVWSAAGAVLNSVIFDTSLAVTQTVTFGGVAGINAGTVTECTVKGEVNIYSVADAELMQLKGKIYALTNLYAGSLIGYNTGLVSGNTANAISYDIPAEYGHIGIPYVITGKSYTVTYEIVNHGNNSDEGIGVDITE